MSKVQEEKWPGIVLFRSTNVSYILLLLLYVLSWPAYILVANCGDMITDCSYWLVALNEDELFCRSRQLFQGSFCMWRLPLAAIHWIESNGDDTELFRRLAIYKVSFCWRWFISYYSLIKSTRAIIKNTSACTNNDLPPNYQPNLFDY